MLACSAFIIISICLEDRNVFARFNEIPSITILDTRIVFLQKKTDVSPF